MNTPDILNHISNAIAGNQKWVGIFLTLRVQSEEGP
jgi:hypothetical protein